MNKYTELEQVLQDPSLTIITNDIKTLKDLNKIYIKYKILPKRNKRYSNYYSNKFLGHTVPEMYVLIKNNIMGEINFLKDKQLPSEKYIHSEPDLYYKEESFNMGDTNLCFILGHSGSGKSVMASILEGETIDHIELDDLLLTKDHFTIDDLKNYSDMLYSFFTGEGSKYYIGVKEREKFSREEYEDKIFIDFVNFAIDYSKKHKEKNYIIEGIWIYLYFDDPSIFSDYAVFIKGTSFLKSKIRVAKREIHRDKKALQDRKNMFERETRNYLLDENKIDNYRNYFKEKKDTVFRDEANENEIVAKEINRINECFVNGDSNSINEIMEKAESNRSLLKWNKLRIINECKLALLDLNKNIPKN